MKCTNKVRRICFCMSLILCMSLLTGCGNVAYTFPYDVNSSVSSFNVLAGTGAGRAEPFAADLCVVTEDQTGDGSVDMSQASAAVLFDVNNKKVLYSKNAHERLYPASLTKVMTALVALQNASPDTVLTATDSVKITESGAQLCGLKVGDTMTLDQALHILLMYSANDAAMLIAENIGGSVDHFVEMMNEEAQRLGATNTSFANPHGLSDDNHYTSAYDLYLIFNESIKYDSFNEIIHMTSYQTAYYDKDGKAKELTVNSTNRFLRGDFQAPENITVIGGKTGTTNAAGHCLILLSRDTSGAPYISVILNSSASDVLYPEMVQLLEQINK